MAESLFNEEVSGERNRPLKGLARVGYGDGGFVSFQKASIEHLSLELGDDYGGATVPYDGLVGTNGYRMQPYSLFPEVDGLVAFGSALTSVPEKHEDVLSVLTQAQLSDKKFLDVVGVLKDMDPYEKIQQLRNKVATQAKDAAHYYPDALEAMLRKREIDMWVRLERQRVATTVMAETIVAKLVHINVEHDTHKMIPIVENHDGSMKVAISQDLVFGDPWLYVGEEYYNP